jgi:hypothetical protein
MSASDAELRIHLEGLNVRFRGALQANAGDFVSRWTASVSDCLDID